MSDELIEKVLKENNVKGVLHLGACAPCMQLPIYQKYNLNNIILVEGNPELIEYFKEGKQNLGNAKLLQEVISDKSDQEIDFHIIYSDDNTNLGCSSLLKYAAGDVFPFIKERKQIKTKTCSVDDLFEKYNLDMTQHNFLVMDIQGAELLALKGAKKYLECVDFICTEVCFRELYKDQGLNEDIVSFLKKSGFIQTNLIKQHAAFGEALFVRI